MADVLPPPPGVNADLSQAPDTDFEKVHGAPQLPQGASNLPAWPVAPVVNPEPTVPTPPPEFLARMTLLSAEDQALIQQWFIYCWRRNSPYLEGALITTPDLMIRHIHAQIADQEEQARQATKDREAVANVALKEQRIEKQRQKEANRITWNAWVEECRARKERINRAKAELDKRRAEYAEFEKQLEAARVPWNEYVNAAHVEYVDAKAVPAPVRPDLSKD